MPSIITIISPDEFEPGEAIADLVQDEGRPVTILDPAECTAAAVPPRWPPTRRPSGTCVKCCRPRRARWKFIAREITPWAASAKQIKDRIHRRTHISLAWTPTRRRVREQWLQQLPFQSNCLDSALHRADRSRVALPSTSRITKSVALQAVNHATSATAITF